jgi:hypothetical protein
MNLELRETTPQPTACPLDIIQTRKKNKYIMAPRPDRVFLSLLLFLGVLGM